MTISNFTSKLDKNVNHKKVLIGKIISTKSDKTLIVEIITSRTHPIYKKKYFSTKKYHVHTDEMNYKVGDSVKFVETKPISKTKHHKVAK